MRLNCNPIIPTVLFNASSTDFDCALEEPDEDDVD